MRVIARCSHAKQQVRHLETGAVLALPFRRALGGAGGAGGAGGGHLRRGGLFDALAARSAEVVVALKEQSAERTAVELRARTCRECTKSWAELASRSDSRQQSDLSDPHRPHLAAAVEQAGAGQLCAALGAVPHLQARRAEQRAAQPAEQRAVERVVGASRQNRTAGCRVWCTGQALRWRECHVAGAGAGLTAVHPPS